MAATTEAATAAAAAATSQIKSSNAPKVCDKKLFFIYLFIYNKNYSIYYKRERQQNKEKLI